MDLQLKGKKVLITSSTMGIGKAIATLLAAEGATVIINGRNQDKIDQTILDIEASYPDISLGFIAADLGTKEGCEQVIAPYPDIDILINNLGIFEPVDYFDATDKDWYKQFEVNI